MIYSKYNSKIFVALYTKKGVFALISGIKGRFLPQNSHIQVLTAMPIPTP